MSYCKISGFDILIACNELFPEPKFCAILVYDLPCMIYLRMVKQIK